MACLWDRKESESRVCAIVPSNSTVISTICNIIRFAGLTPKLVPVLLQGLQVMHPGQLSHGSILLVIGAGIDEDVKTTIECQHAVIEVSPVNILLRVDGFIHFLITLCELRVLGRLINVKSFVQLVRLGVVHGREIELVRFFSCIKIIVEDSCVIVNSAARESSNVVNSCTTWVVCFAPVCGNDVLTISSQSSDLS